jgi:hypothetical protein
MATNPDTNGAPMKFQSILQLDVPKGRDGKHKKIVTQLLSDIEQLVAGTALKVPLSALPDSKENIRSALNRATRQKGIEVATSSDEEHLTFGRSSRNPNPPAYLSAQTLSYS